MFDIKHKYQTQVSKISSHIAKALPPSDVSSCEETTGRMKERSGGMPDTYVGGCLACHFPATGPGDVAHSAGHTTVSL